MEALTCSGFFFLSLWWSVLVFSWLEYFYVKASGEGRGCAHRALLLFPSLLLFSSVSYGASSVSGFTTGSGCYSSQQAACVAGGYSWCVPGGQCDGTYYGLSYPGCYYTNTTAGGPGVNPCSQSCSPSSSETIASSSLWSEYFSHNSYCDPSTGCVTSGVVTGSSQTQVSNGAACFARTVSATAPVVSNPSPPPVGSCPVGFYPYDSSGCVCTNGSGSFVNSYGTSVNPSCNGGSPTAPVLSPVSPVTSNGQTSCPPSSASITNGSSTSCYVVKVPPAVNNGSTPGGSPGGGGGGSSYHLAAPTKSSNGQLTCPPGASSIGNGNSLECIVSGPAPLSAPTGSGTSGTSPTGSTASGNNYPTSFSMPTVPTDSVTIIALGQVASAQESTSQQCPSPVTFDVMSHTFSISFTYACQLAAQVRPVVIGVFSMASLLLLVK